MYEPRDVPAWVRTHYRRQARARGTEPPPFARGVTGEMTIPPLPTFARGSAPELDDATEIQLMLPEHLPAPVRRRKRRVWARLLFVTSFAVVAATVTVAGARMWREARKVPVPPPAAVAIAGDGRLELSPDRRAIARIGRAGAVWTAPQQAALDSIQVTGSLVLGRTSGALVGVDLTSGTTRFSWALPAGERWGEQAPVELGACLMTITIRGEDSLARCIDLAKGAPRWTAKIAGGRECIQAPQAVPGAYLVQCPGWTTVIDDRDGAVSFDAGGIALVQEEPAMLLRGGPKPVLAPWMPATRKFAVQGTAVKGADAASSAVLHGGRVVVRARAATDKLALITGKAGAQVAISAPELQLADDAPLVLDCGGGASPRFQLVELAPRAGATFDPEAAQHRVLALIDVEAGRLAWTSKKIIPPRHLGATATPLCRNGQYLVPVELRDATGAASSALWVLDAETGATTAAVAFAEGSEASFADLRADQIDGERIVGVGRGGAFELRWRRGAAADVPVPGLREARAELEKTLGRLP